MTAYQNLTARFKQIANLENGRAILGWDEAAMMPEGSGPYRNETIAELAMIIQKLTASPEVGDWLSHADADASLSSPQKANVREMKRIYIENTAIPPELNQRLVMAKMESEQKWRVLRGQNNWAEFTPYLQNVLDLTREMLAAVSAKKGLELYDTALSLYSPGLTSTIVQKLFDELKTFLPSTINEVIDRQSRETTIQPEGRFPMAAQKALGLELMKAVGFDFQIGRLDESHHPFCGGAPRDVRITTRYDETDFTTALMGVLHETGHAMYEQNLPQEWLGQPAGLAAGMAIHESQSLFMEMQVCRSKEFIHFAAPIIRKHLGPHVKNPESLSDENLVKIYTRVEKGFIRVDADEVTYPAHVILRFELEKAMLEGQLNLRDLPGAWNEKMQAYLGLSTLGNDKNGCMQDVHWPAGLFGYFPAYTFGAVIAAQLFAKITSESPDVRTRIAKGDFSVTQEWLRQHIWSRGSQLGTLDLVREAAGELSTGAFRAHLDSRYLS